MRRRLIPVSELVHYLKGQLEDNPVLHGVWVKGEMSNLRRPNSGHWYFSLKDSQASLPCVMFRMQASAVSFSPKDGDKVELIGDVTVYEKEGRMQLRVSSMKPAGIGDLYLQLEELKKRLQAEGLFRDEHKKPLPPYPMSFGIVTGNDTAARQDIYRTFLNRWPCAKITDYPTPVQGKEAVPKIIEALARADQAGHDVILLVRGGGSMEDLWCFNDENLVRFIYNMKTPVVTGVGHESDTTLVDYVADRSANTPTGAVEKAAPDYHAIENVLHHQSVRMNQAVENRLKNWQTSFRSLSQRSCFTSPERFYEERAMRLDAVREKLLRTSQISVAERARLNQYTETMRRMMLAQSSTMRQKLQNDAASMRLASEKALLNEKAVLKEKKQQMLNSVQLDEERASARMKHTISLLDAYSPLKVLARGYSVVSQGGHSVNSIHQIRKDKPLEIHMTDGSVLADVTAVTEGKK
jgi:exodeoxyribonuclease VII large subunit